MKNLALLISGGATTACAILDACFNGKLREQIKPTLVIASHSGVSGIQRVLQRTKTNRPNWRWDPMLEVIDRRACSSAEDFGERILRACGGRQVDLLGMYGWMELLPKNVVEEYRGRSVNQHPAPLDPGFPDFGGSGVHGLRAHFMRLQFTRKVGRDYWTEATAHRVEIEFDKGAVIGRARERIRKDDTAETLQKRLLPREHALQIGVLSSFANDTVTEFPREERLVRPGEEPLLTELLKTARAKYPYKR